MDFDRTSESEGLSETRQRGAGSPSAPGHAFISYTREDKESVDRLQQLLENAGIRVWRDTNRLWPGEDWGLRIREAITDGALAFIACFSSHLGTKAQSYQWQELQLAVEQLRLRAPDRAWLIPVRFDDSVLPVLDIGMGRTLGSLQRVDLFGDGWETEGPRLVEGVRRILGEEPPPPPHRSRRPQGLVALAILGVVTTGLILANAQDQGETGSRAQNTPTAETTTLSTDNSDRLNRVQRFPPPTGDPTVLPTETKYVRDGYWHLTLSGEGTLIEASSLTGSGPWCSVTNFGKGPTRGVDYHLYSSPAPDDTAPGSLGLSIQNISGKGVIVLVTLHRATGEPFHLKFQPGVVGEGSATVFLDGSGATFDITLVDTTNSVTAALTGYIGCSSVGQKQPPNNLAPVEFLYFPPA